MTLGVISDTHGLLRPSVSQLFHGVNLIIHAGDIGAESILHNLKDLAPVVAVRGNMDHGPLAANLPLTQTIRVGQLKIHVLHDLNRLDVDPLRDEIQIIIDGHTHRPKLITNNGVCFLNPGSAGPRRNHLPVTLAKMDITSDSVLSLSHIDLDQYESRRG